MACVQYETAVVMKQQVAVFRLSCLPVRLRAPTKISVRRQIRVKGLKMTTRVKLPTLFLCANRPANAPFIANTIPRNMI